MLLQNFPTLNACNSEMADWKNLHKRCYEEGVALLDGPPDAEWELVMVAAHELQSEFAVPYINYYSII